MESPIAKLFLAIQDRISDQIPEVKYIDQNLGQYMHEEFRKQMVFPAILIDFPVVDFSEMQGNSQFAEVTIVATMFHDAWNNSSSLTPLNIKVAGLQYLEQNQKLFIALQGWNTEDCEALTRKQQKSQNANETGLRVQETTFTTQFEDRSCDDATPRIQLAYAPNSDS